MRALLVKEDGSSTMVDDAFGHRYAHEGVEYHPVIEVNAPDPVGDGGPPRESDWKYDMDKYFRVMVQTSALRRGFTGSHSK